MDPFAEEDEASPEPPPARPRRPWWKWNFFVLAGALFAVLWVRELVGMPVGGAVMIALFVVATWVIGPAIAMGVPLVPGPMPRKAREPAPSSPTRERFPLSLAARWCRFAALVIGVLGVLQALIGGVLDAQPARSVRTRSIGMDGACEPARWRGAFACFGAGALDDWSDRGSRGPDPSASGAQ